MNLVQILKIFGIFVAGLILVVAVGVSWVASLAMFVGLGWLWKKYYFNHKEEDQETRKKRKRELIWSVVGSAATGAQMAFLTNASDLGKLALFAGITVSGILFWPLISTGWKFVMGGPAETADKRLRGAQLVDEKTVAKLVKDLPADAQIGSVPIPVEIEPRGFLLAGAPGTGKSLIFIQLLSAFRNRGDKAVVFDVSGQMLEKFYKPGDIVFNPLDSRSPAWSPFAEIGDPRLDCDRFSKSLVPDQEGSGAEWNFFAQQTVSSILKQLIAAGRTTNADFLDVLANSSLQSLSQFVQGTVASRLINEDAKGMTASILGILGAYAAPFHILSPSAGNSSFSLRKWMTDENEKGWIFLTVRDDQSALLNPLISCWIDILISALLSMQPDHQRRVIFALDEFASLPKINSLMDAGAKVRKYGGSLICGLQSVSQVRARYGRESAQTLLSTLGTWMTFRSPDTETAGYLSQFLGNEERRRRTETVNDNGTSVGESIQSTEIVMASELQKLKDRHGYLSLAGHYPICQTIVPIPSKSEPVAPAFQ